MSAGLVHGIWHSRRAESRVVHAEGREEAVADEGLPLLPGDGLERGARDDVAHVGVVVGLQRRELRGRAEHLLREGAALCAQRGRACEHLRPGGELADFVGEAAAVGEDGLDGDRAQCGVNVGEVGEGGLLSGRPLQRALLDEDRGKGGRH